jgi:hypothetical protein
VSDALGRDLRAAGTARYLSLHRQAPQRELYVLHADRETVEIAEPRSLGIRAARS